MDKAETNFDGSSINVNSLKNNQPSLIIIKPSF